MVISIDKIKVNKGRREINWDKVKSLSESIQEIGLLQPIVINQDNVLIAGQHRLEACKLLGRTEIMAAVSSVTGLKAELAEIDENLMRNELDPIEIGELAIRRDEILEAMGERANTSNKGNTGKYQVTGELNSPVKTTADIAKEIGISERVLQQNKQLARNLAPEAKKVVKEADITKTEALKLSRMDQEKQKAVADKIVRGEALTVEAAEAILAGKKPHVANNSGNNEWYTPKEYIDAARYVMGGIDLDPASCEIANETVKAANYYDIETDGLSKNWNGRVWMNPPYAGELIPLFTNKLMEHVRAGSVTEAIVLVNNATETSWFNTLIDIAAAVIFPKARVKFYMPNGETGAPLQGQAVIYIGKNYKKFLDVFKKFGWGAVID